jgi:hypothetical protein
MRQVRWAVAVLAALLISAAGCGDDHHSNGGGTPRPTATRTATRTSTVAVPTVTPGGPTLTPTATSVPQATNSPGGGSFGGSQTVQRFLSGVLGTVSSLSDFAGGSSGALTAGRAEISLPPIAVPCLSGGTIQTGCTPDASGSQLSFTFNGCTTSTGGVRTFLDGVIAIDSPGSCPGVPLPVGQPFGVVVDATIEASGRGRNVSGSFDVSETVTQNADGSTVVEASGSVDTECTGAVAFETIEPLLYARNAECASGGSMRVTVEQGDALVTFTASGGIEIDYKADGSVDDTFRSCTDAKLKRCG